MNNAVFELIRRITPILRRHRPDADAALRRETVNRFLTDGSGKIRTDL